MSQNSTHDDSTDTTDAEAPIPPIMDGVTINRIMTAYLNTLHSLKGGHLSAPDAFDHIIGGLNTMEDMRTKGRKIWNQFFA